MTKDQLSQLGKNIRGIADYPSSLGAPIADQMEWIDALKDRNNGRLIEARV